MKTYDLDIINPHDLPDQEMLYVYNGIDSLMTKEIFEELEKQVTPQAAYTYRSELAFRGMALSMQMLGVKVDENKLAIEIANYKNKIEKDLAFFNKWTTMLIGETVNVNSPQQMKNLFYEYFGFPKQYGKDKVVSLDAEDLETIGENPFWTKYTQLILRIKKNMKLLSTLETPLQNGRMHTNFQIAGTVTGRWASKQDIDKEGTNLQNLNEKVRRVYVPDSDEWVFAYIDLAQAEARLVAYCAADPAYIKACESGDLHTLVAQGVFTELDWQQYPAEINEEFKRVLKENRKIANQDYRGKSYRQYAKGCGHGTNYGGQAPTVSAIAGVDIRIVQDFQRKYFAAYPKIKEWHFKIKEKLQTTKTITTALNRTRQFFGNTLSNKALHEAIAQEPQSTIADYVNTGLHFVWKHYMTKYDIKTTPVKLLVQVHDAGLFMIKKDRLAEEVKNIQSIWSFPIKYPIGDLLLPSDAHAGKNWGELSKENPDGLGSIHFEGE